MRVNTDSGLCRISLIPKIPNIIQLYGTHCCCWVVVAVVCDFCLFFYLELKHYDQPKKKHPPTPPPILTNARFLLHTQTVNTVTKPHRSREKRARKSHEDGDTTRYHHHHHHILHHIQCTPRVWKSPTNLTTSHHQTLSNTCWTSFHMSTHPLNNCARVLCCVAHTAPFYLCVCVSVCARQQLTTTTNAQPQHIRNRPSNSDSDQSPLPMCCEHNRRKTHTHTTPPNHKPSSATSRRSSTIRWRVRRTVSCTSREPPMRTVCRRTCRWPPSSRRSTSPIAWFPARYDRRNRCLLQSHTYPLNVCVCISILQKQPTNPVSNPHPFKNVSDSRAMHPLEY